MQHRHAPNGQRLLSPGPSRTSGARDRRDTAQSSSTSPEGLVARHLEAARRQLVDRRNQLIQARRRVVQLEDAVANWERLAADLRAGREHPAPPR